MNVGIVGLGLIGGSFAKAFAKEGHAVFACDRNEPVVGFAKLEGTVAQVLTEKNLKDCDLLLLCLYVDDAVNYLEDNASHISKDTLVMDVCGTKTKIMEKAVPVSQAHGFSFVGGHPMAGKQYSGYGHASADLFRNAPMVLVPPSFDDIRLLTRAKEALSPAGFGKFTITTAEAHDRVIAYTSQLPHVISSAYVKSPASKGCRPLSAGSFRDMTRVSSMNETMWTDLFLENRAFLTEEIDRLIGQLAAYRDAIASGNREAVGALIREGCERKKEVGQ
ncbi:MAG: prephenate dehydrogenase [Clostridia bacterium]|nr:prephenate dehydrogenase [Clostridia bacterium]